MITFEDFLMQHKARLDAHQLEAVHCDVNCVVSAGAGSGKTTVLSYRFLRLVLEGKAEVGEILTLTFTRKAAREMQERIHRHLLCCKNDERIVGQLATFSEASISTLDSFCSQIVRSDSIRYGIAQDFIVDDEQNLRNARRCATELLDTWPQSQGARILCGLYSPDKLVDDVLVPLASNAYCMPKQVEEDAHVSILSAVQTVFDQSWDAFSSLLDSYANLTDTSKTVQTAREAALSLRSSLEACTSAEEKHRILCSALGYFRKPGAGKAEQMLYIKETIEEFNQLRKKLCIARSVLLGSSQLQAVLSFMQEYIASYQKQKRQSGVLTFADISSLAVEILSSNKSLRHYYKMAYKYIMIDEFQDNNEQQKQLLYLLSERLDREGDGIPGPENLKADKLFFVGDEKQSIYRFRGSDVSVFKRLSWELCANGGRHIQLDTNYRSEPALIQWFNTLFPSVMQNNGESFEADFSALGWREPSEGIQSKCTVLIKPYESKLDEDEEDAADTDAEAYAVASLIDEMLHTDSYLIPSETGPHRPATSDIALLLRTTSSQLSFEKALRRFNIPYTVQAARSLMLEAPANDMYAMLQLVLYPQDRHAYMTVLRSPFCNLSDFGMTEVLDCPCFSIPDSIGPEDRSRLEAVGVFYEHLKKASATASLSSLVSLLWYESGYYLSLVATPSYQVYTEHYAFLHRLAQMQQQQGKSLSQFVDFLRDNLAQNEKIENLEVIKEQEEGVQILSIHKSKGLEFPIVVVANTGSKGRSEEDAVSTYQGISIPHYVSVPYHVSETRIETAKHAGQLLDKGTEAQLNRAELKRLLYVALTRAQTHVVVSGCFSKTNRSLAEDGRSSTLLLMLAQSLGIDIDAPALEQGIVTVRSIAGIAESLLYDQKKEDEQAFEQRIDAAASFYAPREEAYEMRPIRYAVTALHAPLFSETAKALPSLASDALFSEAQVADFGTFVHALCEQMVLQPSQAIDALAMLPPSLVGVNQQQVIADALFLCHAFVGSSWYRTEVQPYPVSCEVGFFSLMEHEGRAVVVEGSVDLLIKRKDHYLVVDFKTDRFRDEEVHRFQLQTYMQAMARIHQCPVKGCVVYLRDVQNIVVWEGENL